ncbi:3-hydroxyacyl-CoA dehydrogenase family protein [Mangrovihabitans endophyticus]|uniref:3-hydroxybutyryl-CoA dehydrogenase n=1 Tax=Mangrovihabitans endophyticus TaxID=1751298 RepID=A0A8J3FN72_9ACTN|nr:3-hydroxyacyl-CoA dehydrogenase family protein [Mangrovihabitans endophyticus]GGK79078.1 3-hydroxybutyryl-CoA dehydrogenase [Mangrovihabitans endophyticus]
MTDPVVIVGAGVMGTGIATLALVHGTPVTLVDTVEEKLTAAGPIIATGLRTAGLMGAAPAGVEPAGLTLVTGLADALAARPAAAVIEAITEDAGRKADVLARVCAAVKPGTPLVTNTSSIPIDELAHAVARPEDLLGVHFMNPSYLISTVELARGRRTGAAAESTAVRVLESWRRRVIVVRDAPGFVTSRLLHPMINNAARVVEEGTASVAEVDELMHGCLGHPTGPLRTADLIGIDNLVDSLWVLHERSGDESCRPCDLLLSKVRDGHFGRKSGRGFYEYGSR